MASQTFGLAQVEEYLTAMKTNNNLRNTDLISKAIEFVQKNAPADWQGHQKKQLVIDAVTTLTKDAPVSLDPSLVGDLVDAFVGLAKGKGLDPKIFIKHKEGLLSILKACFTGCHKKT